MVCRSSWYASNSQSISRVTDPVRVAIGHRLRIDLTHPREYLGATFFRNTLTGDDLKATGPTGSPLSTPDVTAIQTDRDGRSGFRRLFDLELASGIESELLGAPFSLESLGGLKHMGANGLAIQARIDGQHVM
jgi:hypothetical protein